MDITRTNRYNIYAILARVFEKEADDTLLELVQSDNWITLLGEGIGQIPHRSFKETLNLLGEEYTRLFLGPGHHISPYASAWCDGGALWGETTVFIANTFKNTGLALKPAQGNLPDHISILLEYMFRLVEHEWKIEGDKEQTASLKKMEADFFDIAINSWVPRFCERVIREADFPFYSSFAELLLLFLESERVFLPLPVSISAKS